MVRIRFRAVTASVDPAALRAARQRAGLTQHRVARELDVAGGEAVARWERGASEPRPAILRRLAELLGVAPGDLLRRDGGRIDLRYLRLAVGLESAAVAEQLHVSVATYLRWERGAWTVTPGEATVAGLAEAFGVGDSVVAAALAHTRALGAGTTGG
jgi:transcriptional regulator with XRE-family HTH domain